MSYELRAVMTPDDWRAMHDIRQKVLFAPGRHSISYDENHPDDRADGNTPFLLFENEEPLGVARLDERGETGIVRLVAIVQHKQRKGYGLRLNNFIEAEARRRGVRILRVNAAPDAVGFYLKAGWSEKLWDPTELVGLAQGAVQMEKVICE